MSNASSGDLRTLANGLIPSGFEASKLTPEGRDEVREAIDVILKLSDHRNAKLSLALEQLDKAAAEIERLRAASGRVASILSRHLCHQLSHLDSYKELQAARAELVAVLGADQQGPTEK